MTNATEQQYKTLKSIMVQLKGKPSGELPIGSVITKSIFPEKDFDILMKAGGYFEPYPILVEDLNKPVPEIKIKTNELDNPFFMTKFTDDELEIPSNIKQGEKFLKDLHENVIKGLESYEKVERMINKLNTKPDSKSKDQYMQKLNMILRTKK